MSLEKTVKLFNERTAILSKDSEKDAEIAALKRLLSEKDMKIKELGTEIKVKDGQILEKDSKILEKDHKIGDLTAQLEQQKKKQQESDRKIAAFQELLSSSVGAKQEEVKGGSYNPKVF